MSEVKQEIIELLETVKRPGINDLIEWLKQSDFFTAPASMKYHGSHSGGLAEHSLNVCDSLTLLNDQYRDKENRYSDETIIIVSLLHDVCKIDMYIEDTEAATGPQMDYLKKLIKDSPYNMPDEKELTKPYVQKLIDFLKNGGEFPEFTTNWKIKEQLPMGHGEKSVYLIQKFIDLTDEEALAIRWHLGAFDPGTHFFYPSGSPNKQAVEEYPLVSMIVAADYIATWLVERK